MSKAKQAAIVVASQLSRPKILVRAMKHSAEALNALQWYFVHRRWSSRDHGDPPDRWSQAINDQPARSPGTCEPGSSAHVFRRRRVLAAVLKIPMPEVMAALKCEGMACPYTAPLYPHGMSRWVWHAACRQTRISLGAQPMVTLAHSAFLYCLPCVRVGETLARWSLPSSGGPAVAQRRSAWLLGTLRQPSIARCRLSTSVFVASPLGVYSVLRYTTAFQHDPGRTRLYPTWRAVENENLVTTESPASFLLRTTEDCFFCSSSPVEPLSHRLRKIH